MLSGLPKWNDISKKNIETNNIISMHSLKKFSSSFVLEKKSDFKHGFGTTMGIINII